MERIVAEYAESMSKDRRVGSSVQTSGYFPRFLVRTVREYNEVDGVGPIISEEPVAVGIESIHVTGYSGLDFKGDHYKIKTPEVTSRAFVPVSAYWQNCPEIIELTINDNKDIILHEVIVR